MALDSFTVELSFNQDRLLISNKLLNLLLRHLAREHRFDREEYPEYFLITSVSQLLKLLKYFAYVTRRIQKI